MPRASVVMKRGRKNATSMQSDRGNDQIEAEVVTEAEGEVATIPGTVTIHHSRVPLQRQQNLMCSNVLTIYLDPDANILTTDDHLHEVALAITEDHLRAIPILTSLEVAVKKDEDLLHRIEPAALDPDHHYRGSEILLPDLQHLQHALNERRLAVVARASKIRGA